MKTIFLTIGMMVLSAALSLRPASAAPGDDFNDSGVEILDTASDTCQLRSAMCMTAGPNTVVDSYSSASAMEGSHPGAMGVPQFSRVGRDSAGHGQQDDPRPWAIDLNANLRRPALAGNAVFLVFDAEDPKAIQAHQVVGVWQASVHSGEKLSARLTLSPDDGFRAAHSYMIRVVQIVGGKEVPITEGTVRLL